MVRRGYHFNTTSAARKDGIYLNDPCDLHFRQNADYPTAPYGIDSDQYNVLGLGDRLLYKPNSGSLPIEIVGGKHYYIVEKNANYTLTIDDTVLRFDTSGGDRTLTLPLTTAFHNGKTIYVNKITSANKLIFSPSGAETISGFTGTQFYIEDPHCIVKLISDKNAGIWRIYIVASRTYNLSNEFPMSSTVTINSGSFQTVRTWSNVMLTDRYFQFFINGSGWYNNVEFTRVRFALYIDSVIVAPSLCYWHNAETTKHLTFSGQCIARTTCGLHTLEVRARREAGTNAFSMDNSNDFITCDLIQV